MKNLSVLFGVDKANHSLLPNPPTDGVLITPSSNNWNDFHYQLLVDVWTVQDGQIEHLSIGKMLIEGQRNTSAWLKKELSETELGIADTTWLFRETNYLFTLPSLKEYSRLMNIFGKIETKDVLLSIHDVGTLRTFAQNNPSLETLSLSEGYRKALFREDLAFEASVLLEDLYASASNAVFDEQALKIEFKAHLPYGVELPLNLTFPSTPFGISRICVLIGENGIGKTEILRSIVTKGHANQLMITKESEVDDKASQVIPRFQRTIFFPSSLDDQINLVERDAPEDRAVKILPGPASKDGWKNVTKDLLAIFRGASARNSGINNYEILRRTLDEYLDLDTLHIPVSPTTSSIFPYTTIDGKSYSKILATRTNEERYVEMLNACIVNEGPIFVAQNNSIIRLSSGQKSFLALAVALIRNIQDNSIVLIDEPELSLHPKMIAGLIRLLDEILEIKKAYCVIATHSLHLIREVPRESVHVIKKSNDRGVRDYAPFMQTFGADLSLLSTIVFSEDEILELFEKKIEQKLLNNRNMKPEDLVAELSGHMGSVGSAVLKDNLLEQQNEKN